MARSDRAKERELEEAREEMRRLREKLEEATKAAATNRRETRKETLPLNESPGRVQRGRPSVAESKADSATAIESEAGAALNLQMIEAENATTTAAPSSSSPAAATSSRLHYEFKLQDDELRRSFTAHGDTRVARVVRRLLNAQPITILLLGGSSSLGRTVSPYSQTFMGRVAAWLATVSPGVNHSVINSARGATGSSYMSKCMQLHKTGFDHRLRVVTAAVVDLVLVEYAVNDYHTALHLDSTTTDIQMDMDVLTRRLLSGPQPPAVIFLQLYSLKSLLHEPDYNGEEISPRVTETQNHVARKYHVPVLHLESALSLDTAKRGLAPDEVHINPTGHRYAADAIVNYLRQVAEGVGQSSSAHSTALLDVDSWHCWSAMAHRPTLHPVHNQGWHFDEQWSRSDNFKVPGTSWASWKALDTSKPVSARFSILDNITLPASGTDLNITIGYMKGYDMCGLVGVSVGGELLGELSSEELTAGLYYSERTFTLPHHMLKGPGKRPDVEVHSLPSRHTQGECHAPEFKLMSLSVKCA